ncbi:hypothetical protein CDAR_436871 [Caerostris darwini]|uniref:Uncharacterized protein n=1 Tax=Caerostris darwini TaxID=1538125 RepID=A0AAV4TDN6_9ARAC|nr:hypothetical protein CDAR_436871 [Caerostris darwini]
MHKYPSGERQCAGRCRKHRRPLDRRALQHDLRSIHHVALRWLLIGRGRQNLNIDSPLQSNTDAQVSRISPDKVMAKLFRRKLCRGYIRVNEEILQVVIIERNPPPFSTPKKLSILYKKKIFKTPQNSHTFYRLSPFVNLPHTFMNKTKINIH